MKQRILLVMLLALWLFIGCDGEKTSREIEAGDLSDSASIEISHGSSSATDQIRLVTKSETLIQALSAKKSLLGKWMVDGSMEVPAFAKEEIELRGIGDMAIVDLLDSNSKHSRPGLVSEVAWPIESEFRKSKFSQVWRNLPGKFHDAQFGVLGGTFLDEENFETRLKFEGRMRTDDGQLVGVRAKQIVGWAKKLNGVWEISSWNQTAFSVVVASSPVFEEITDAAIPDLETRRKIALASHENLLIERCNNVGEIETEIDGRPVKEFTISGAREQFKGCNDWGSVGQYPTVSTTDFNGDGLDDLFITDRWQPPQLLKNNGDLTFSDVTSEVGIDVAEFANCGYFFDYDNDGDSDLFLGMSMVPSLFFENDGGRFKRHESINESLLNTRMVTAVSVSDINQDGLLDMYLSTYSIGVGPIDDWIRFMTSESEQLKTKLKIIRGNEFMDRGGPPNILMVNHGNSFEQADVDDTLKQYRNSYQSSWMDYDGDGDHDLYICNDFSPDVFLRNETPRGSYDFIFSDVTEEVIPSRDMGFGMGCAWGDFDNDGDLDLYVSNMYSKAGNRIVDQLEGVGSKFKVAAQGNFLFKNENGNFTQVAGDGFGSQHVARIGWSYGGQFADFDNDGELDLYVPSGCYSAPEEVKSELDL